MLVAMHPCTQCSLVYSAGYLAFESSVAVKDLSDIRMLCRPIRSCDVTILSAFLGVYVCLFC